MQAQLDLHSIQVLVVRGGVNAYAWRILAEMIFDHVPSDSNSDIAVEIYAFDRRRIAVLRHRLTIPTTSANSQASSHHPMNDP